MASYDNTERKLFVDTFLKYYITLDIQKKAN